MSARHLTVVAEAIPAEYEPQSESLSGKIRRLQAEARDLAQGHVGLLCASLAESVRIAAEIAEGGEAYPVGARELCRRMAEDLAFQIRTLSAISERC
ncbi:MAG TPA: hypothetical protein VGS12_14355 [Caulobacteraceae bacterium]|nr:hypothetical protein [Caulobacteraceae bacterium]